MRIKEYTSPLSGEIALLVDAEEMPLQFANRYAYSMIEKPGGSLSSVKKALYVISRLYLWAEIRGLDIEHLVFYGDFLTLDNVSDLVDFIHFTSAAQKIILSIKQQGGEGFTPTRSNIVNFRSSAEISYQYTSNQVYASRLRALKKFFAWVLVERRAQRINTANSVVQNLGLGLNTIKNNIPRVKSRRDDEKLEAVDLDTIERIAKILQPDHPENPFSTLFIRHRNYLLLLLLIESGGRREEVYHAKSKDIIASTLQFDIKVSKTVPRTVPVSNILIAAFEKFHKDYWRHLNGRGKKTGYLFVKSNGERMSLRAVNYVIETVRKSIPEEMKLDFH